MPTLTKGTNSYLTVAEATTLLDNTFYSAEWAAKSDDDKARSLITATRFVNNLPLQGYRVETDQALAFPRVVHGATQTATPDDVLLAVALEATSNTESLSVTNEAISSLIFGSSQINFNTKTQSLSSGLGFTNQESYDLLSIYIAHATELSRV